jgi:hypothetical protein
MLSSSFDLIEFERALDAELKKGSEAFRGKYGRELDELAGLSRKEIDAISPGITDLETYDRLITVVKEASRVNLAQANLKKQILKLGDTAIKIAKRVPAFAAILA